MKTIKIISAVFVLLVVLTGAMAFAQGSGTVRVGYVILDEEGNQAVNHGTFNEYEGAAISLENFNYAFGDNYRLTANLKNISLNNRNLNMTLGQNGRFGLALSNNQYRRAYNFDGASFTRRHDTRGSLWFRPHEAVRLFAGGSFWGKTGSTYSLFELSDPNAEKTQIQMDNEQTSFNGGVEFLYQGRMFRAEYEGQTYRDNKDNTRDQKRSNFGVSGYFPVPNYEWIKLTGGFRHFSTKFDNNDFEISANTGKGGVQADLPLHFTISYYFIFDRAQSDSDLVATDNLAHAGYISKEWPGRAGATVGYQHDINDDFEDEVSADSYYLSGWLKPARAWELRGEFGSRAEEIATGNRLLGNQDDMRYRLSAQYKINQSATFRLRYDNRTRENDLLGSEIDYSRISTDAFISVVKFGFLAAGYSYSLGEYENSAQEFEFRDHLLYGDIKTREYRGLTLGGGIVYYKSQRDLDVERITLRLSGEYRFVKDYSLEVIYSGQNFDDLSVTDEYYTANLINISLKKNFSL